MAPSWVCAYQQGGCPYRFNTIEEKRYHEMSCLFRTCNIARCTGCATGFNNPGTQAFQLAPNVAVRMTNPNIPTCFPPGTDFKKPDETPFGQLLSKFHGNKGHYTTFMFDGITFLADCDCSSTDARVWFYINASPTEALQYQGIVHFSNNFHGCCLTRRTVELCPMEFINTERDFMTTWPVSEILGGREPHGCSGINHMMNQPPSTTQVRFGVSKRPKPMANGSAWLPQYRFVLENQK